MSTKTTSELKAGDVVIVNGRHPRTVDRIVDSGYLNYRNETIWTVLYAEGATEGWGPGNTAIALSVWTVGV